MHLFDYQNEMYGYVHFYQAVFDSLEPGPYGPSLIAYSLITFLILKYRNNLFHEGLVTQVICGGLCSFLITLISGIFFLITDVREIDYFLIKLIGSFFLGSIVLPVCSYLLSSLIISEEKGGQGESAAPQTFR